MTIDEAINIIKSECYVFNPLNFDRATRINTALDMAIKALEQEPCEDAISRQALIERINNAEENFKADNMESISSDEENPFVDGVLSGVFNIREMVAQAPSVTPTRNKGKWIESNYGNMISQHRWYCSECGGIHHDTETGEWRETFDFRYAYCPNCGAEMESEE